MKTLLLAAICVSTCLANTTTTQKTSEPSLGKPNACFGEDGSCFYYENREKRNWNDAEDSCRPSGGHLASLTSKEETIKFLKWTKELLFSEDKAWIGLNSVGLDGSFQWVDGRLVDYTNWRTSHSAFTQHVCVYVNKNGTWDVAECRERNVALCRTPGATSITTPSTTSSTNSTPFQGYCAHGSYTFDKDEEKCYQLYGSKLSWSGAEKACISNGQELVSVHNMQEQEFLTALLGKMNTSVWIGLKKSPEEELYRWSDSSEFDFSNWAPRQPRDQQMCVEMLGNSKQGGKWNDRSCEQKQAYICQQNRDPTISTTIAPSSQCETPNATFYPYLDSCYNVFFNESLTWSEAQFHCELYGGSLTSITNAKELAFLSLLRRYNHQNDLWIGLSAIKAKKGLFEWADDWPVLISEWENGEPYLMDDSNRTCVALTIDNKWTVRDCEERSNFICKFTNVDPPHAPKPHGKCPNPEDTKVEWTNIGTDHCYYINRYALRSWGEASELCTQLYPGARLASFHSLDELNELNKITNFNESVWIGLSQGLNGFQWSDESPVNFVSWAAKANLQSNCVALKGVSTMWNSSDCNTNRGFICMVDKEEATTSTEITTVTEFPRICGAPASGWKYFDGNCYKVYSDWMKSFNWSSANAYCKGQQSNLSSIHSEEENAFIRKQMMDNQFFATNSDYWLGMFRPGSSESFHWSDKSLVDFTKVPAPFNGSKEEQYCISIDIKTESWNQTACTNQNGLVCKKPFIPTIVTTTPVPGTSTEYPGFCDIGWTRLGNKCVKIFDDESLNWTRAHETCKQKYDDLFAIHSKHEEMIITSLVENYNRSLWIGLRRIMQDQFEWSDGTEMDFAYWGAGEPSRNQDNCVSLETSTVRAGKWRNSMCNEKRGYICQSYPSKTVTTMTPEYDNRTDDGFVKYSSADYKFELNMTKASNWKEAEEACQMYGGHLASINSPYEQAFIYTQLDTVKGTEGLWIGLADLKENGMFKWTDKWPIYFTDWAVGEPQHPSHNTRCVYLDLKTEEWRSGDCYKPRAYICKVTDEKPPPKPVNNGTCPEHLKNWIDVENEFCYYISSTADKDMGMTWSEASMYCKQKGASLASFHHDKELDLLGPYFRNATQAMWIGMLKKYYGGFEWDDNTALNFVHWDENYPTDQLDKKCVWMSQYNIEWRNDICETKLGFICKVTKVLQLTTTEMAMTTDNSTSNTSDTTVTSPTGNGTESSGSESSVTSEMSSSSSATTGNGPDHEPKTGLGGGGIAGIVIGCLVAVAMVAGGAFFYMKRRRSEEPLINDHSSP